MSERVAAANLRPSAQNLRRTEGDESCGFACHSQLYFSLLVAPHLFKPQSALSHNALPPPRYRTAAQIADAVLAGQMPDPTAGATYFLNPAVVRQRRGGSLPSWAQGEGLSIGRHTFYAPDGAVPL